MSTGADLEVDLLVVGGGSAGFAAAIAACVDGKQVGIVNAGPLGGTCTNRGCIPSKALIRAAEVWRRADGHPFQGVGTTQTSLDWTAIQAQKDQLIGRLREARYVDVLAAYPDIELIEGRATFPAEFQANGTVKVGNRTVRADRYVIATGARPRQVAFPGAEQVEPLDSTSLLELPKLPNSLLVLGGRAVALELGQLMARFGVDVTILQRSGRLLPEHEPEIGTALAQYLVEDDIRVVTGVHIDQLAREGDARIVHGRVLGKQRTWQADQIMFALGRQPNTDRLGLDNAGVDLTPDGAVAVNQYLQTSNPSIYAAGDVTPIPEYVYVAAAAGGLAARNAFTYQPAPFDLSVVPGVIFTDPQVATVGLTENQATAAGHQVRTATIGMDFVARADVAHDPCGLVKLVADSATGKLLGVHLVTPEAGEIIQTGTLAVKHGLTVEDLTSTLFPYLTYAEALRLAAISFDQDLPKLSCCI